jgi:hypothetical protein
MCEYSLLIALGLVCFMVLAWLFLLVDNKDNLDNLDKTNRIIKIKYGSKVSKTLMINTSNVGVFKFIENNGSYEFYIDDIFYLSCIEKEKKQKIECFLQYGETSDRNYTKYETIVLWVINEKLASLTYTGIIKK